MKRLCIATLIALMLAVSANQALAFLHLVLRRGLLGVVVLVRVPAALTTVAILDAVALELRLQNLISAACFGPRGERRG